MVIGNKMAQGLQCWDATGTLTVDLNDYNMRFMGTVSLAVSAGITTWSIPFPSMRPNGWLAVLRTNMPGMIITVFPVLMLLQFSIYQLVVLIQLRSILTYIN
jgi:hypothetical protein